MNDPVTVQGTWRVTIDTPVGERTGLLELNVDGSTLSGRLSAGEHSAEIIDGKVDGNRLTWSAKISKPMRMTVKFSAVIEADRIDGKVKYLMGSASFQGRRA